MLDETPWTVDDIGHGNGAEGKQRQRRADHRKRGGRKADQGDRWGALRSKEINHTIYMDERQPFLKGFRGIRELMIPMVLCVNGDGGMQQDYAA